MIRTNEYLEFAEADRNAFNIGGVQGPPGMGQPLVILISIISMVVFLFLALPTKQPSQLPAHSPVPEAHQGTAPPTAPLIEFKPTPLPSVRHPQAPIQTEQAEQEAEHPIEEPETPQELPAPMPRSAPTPKIVLDITFEGRVLEIIVYNVAEDGTITTAKPIPPELSYTSAGGDFPVYDLPNRNQIWSMPTGTRILQTKFSFQSTPTCDWLWFITLDGQHSGFINVLRQ